MDELGTLIQIPLELRNGMYSLYENWVRSPLMSKEKVSHGGLPRTANESWVTINPAEDELHLYSFRTEDIRDDEFWKIIKATGGLHCLIPKTALSSSILSDT